jgi:diguanylate cyclase (GGDEF)-like protein
MACVLSHSILAGLGSLAVKNSFYLLQWGKFYVFFHQGTNDLYGITAHLKLDWGLLPLIKHVITFVCAAVVFLCATLSVHAAQEQDSLPSQEPLRYSLGQSEPSVVLYDILSGMKQVRFSPIVSNGVALKGKPGTKHWMRLLIEPSAGKQARILSFERKGIRYIRLYSSQKDGRKIIITPLMASESPHGEFANGRWPTRIEYILPAEYVEGGIIYAELQSLGYLHFHPKLSEPLLNSFPKQGASDKFFNYLYLSLLLIALLSLFRQIRRPNSQAILICLSAVISLAAFLAYNTHASLLINTKFLIEPHQSYALLILCIAPFLGATSFFSGVVARWQDAFKWLNSTAVLMLTIAALIWFWKGLSLSSIQMAALILWSIALVSALFAYLFDSRYSKWLGLMIGGGLLAAIWAPYFVYQFLLPDTHLNLYGFQVLFTMLLATYLLQPWLRSLMQERGARKRSNARPVAVELSSEQKIEAARKQLMAGLTSALDNASEADIEWVTYRRLLEGLKPVLQPLSSAVVAKNYHNDDFLMVEPVKDEERYAALINHRSNLLKNLSRMTAPQQIRLDFEGPDGSKQEVNVAIIPLPIEKPGWGALIVERNVDKHYSEKEMDLCSEFAALATTAGDEAAETMAMRFTRETDAETGVLNRKKLDELLKKLLDASLMQHKQLSVLRIGLDKFNEHVAANPDARDELLGSFVSVLQDEVDYGVHLGRFYKDEFVALMPGKNIGQARDLAQRICNAANKISITSTKDIKFTISVGVSHLQPGERNTNLMLERVTAALAKAVQYGGNQIQAISSATI